MVSGINEHPLRRVLANEVHARPYEIIGSPCRVSHIAILGDESLFSVEGSRLLDLCRRYDVDPPLPTASFLSINLGDLRLRWERHSEFSTYTFFRFDDFDLPFEETAFDLAPKEWINEVPGRILVAIHLAVEGSERGSENLIRQFDGNQLIGSLVNGAGAVWTDVQIHDDGFGRALIYNMSLSRGQIGRLVQRLLEIETYRMMALLAFPIAREATPVLKHIESQLATIVAEISAAAENVDERLLLARLTALAAESEQLAAKTSYRFTAARAYHSIVDRRTKSLREERLQGVQTIAEFMERRLAPAMLTCQSVGERLEILSRHLARASDLLRTRVGIALEENNRDLLLSMNRRAKVHLRLQQTVEGLSVVAISYYLLGILSHIIEGVKSLGVSVNPELAILAGLPVVLFLVVIGVRRLRHALGDKEED